MQCHPRPAGAADLSYLMRLEEESFPPERRESRRSIRHSLRSTHQEVWIAGEPDGEPAGAINLRFRGGSCRIYSIAVDPVKRGRGLGRILLEKALEQARRRGCRKLTLEVDPLDAKALGLYRSMGFLPGALCPDFYGAGLPALRCSFAIVD